MVLIMHFNGSSIFTLLFPCLIIRHGLVAGLDLNVRIMC